MRVLYKMFRTTFKSWDTLFQVASDFASDIDQDKLISISHSATEGVTGIVTVWYWGDPATCTKCGYNLKGATSDRCPECGARI